MKAQSHEHIRVVPLYQPKEKRKLEDLGRGEVQTKAAPSGAQLTYRGGALLQNVEVFTVFWGASFQTGTLADLSNKLNQFFDTILQSTLMDQMQEYDTGNYHLGKGKRTGSIVITAPVPGKNITDTQLQGYLQQWISGNSAFPQPNQNTLYFIYLEPGITVSMGGSQSCSSFCGYHNNSNSIYYAVMPYPDCSGCLGNLAPFDALTGTSSHELCEAITDPVPGMGWYDDNNGEIGDICAWQFKTLDGYNVQLEWSNQQNKCV